MEHSKANIFFWADQKILFNILLDICKFSGPFSTAGKHRGLQVELSDLIIGSTSIYSRSHPAFNTV